MLTINEAATAAGVSYATVYRHVQDEKIRSLQADNQVIFVDARDVGKIVKHEPPDRRPKVPVQLKPLAARYKAWERAAGDKPVSVWLGELADRAAVKAAGK